MEKETKYTSEEVEKKRKISLVKCFLKKIASIPDAIFLLF